MEKTVTEIQEYADYLIKEYHANRVLQQLEDDKFYNDTFDVPMIKKPMYICRTGIGQWLIDGVASSVVTRNPQCFVEPKAETKQCRESADSVNSLFNHWLRYILYQVPQPFREVVKNLLLRGEAWINPLNNTDWDDNKDKYIPIQFLTPDPLNVFASPEEINGIPEQVVICYQRSPRIVKEKYPDWVRPDNATGKTVKWRVWFDKNYRYYEADGVPVLKGEIQPNILGEVPFIHGYSGFGKSSPDGNPESMAIGRLLKVRDLLIQECAINSRNDSILHKYAQPNKTLFIPAGSEFNMDEFKRVFDMSAGALNVIPVPDGARFEDTKVEPSQISYNHYYAIRNRIAQEAPPVMAGLPSGTSGRQEDIVGANYIRRFDSIVETTEYMFSLALQMGSRIIDKIPGWKIITQWVQQPDGTKKEITVDTNDFKNIGSVTVKLKSADPIEDDRKLMAGRTLVNDGRIDWTTFLVDYAGYTPEKANQIIVKTIAEKVVMNNPEILNAIAAKGIEKLGLADQISKLDQQLSSEQSSQGAGSRGGEPRTQNIKTPTGNEMQDVNLTLRGVRSTPSGVA
jgi:hypothetical protein